jgi:hypothetical protein
MDLEKSMREKAGRSVDRPVIFLAQRDTAASRQQAAEVLLDCLLRDEKFLRALQEQQG